MELVHCFHSKYCNKNELFSYICYYLLSCLYAKRSGFNIVCYTDAEELFKIIPYDKIIGAFKDLERPHKKFFAYPKFELLPSLDKNQILIDGDVFLKDSSLKDILDLKGYDCIVQGMEMEKYNLWDKDRELFIDTTFPEWYNIKDTYMYNTGVLGFNDTILKNDWVNLYLDLANQVKNGEVKNMYAVPELIAEQQSLLQLTQNRGSKVKTILPYFESFELLKYANNIHYQHVLGPRKKLYLDRCIKTIYNIDKDKIKDLKEIKNIISYEQLCTSIKS